MGRENIDKIYELLDNMPVTKENKDLIQEVKNCLEDGDSWLKSITRTKVP